MKMKSPKFWKIAIFVLLLAWLGFLMAQKIDLATADLGRHIKNGEWVVENHFDLLSQNSPVHENFYSYTNPDFSVPNHHWGSGVIFYEIYKLAGFSGLSVSYIFLFLLTFSIFFYIAARESNFTVAALLSLFLLPLIAERREVRPEAWSYFFAAIFFWLLWKWEKGELAPRWLYILPVLAIFWINLHVYFFLGFFLIGVFWLVKIGRLILAKLTDEEFFKNVKDAKNLTIILITSTLAALVNPFGWRGLIYPLTIFRNYGYTIVENKSVWFVENYGISNPNFLLIKIVLAALLASFALLFFVNRKKIPLHYSLFTILFGTIGWLAIRNFTLLGFFALPILAANFENIFTPDHKDNSPAKENGIAMAFICLAIVAIFSNWQFASAHSVDRGIGLRSGEMAAADFLESEKIAGPIFNNYDIGSYLIFSLPPSEKVFVDNRPEAYPDSFFSEAYKPMQENPDIFSRIDEKYGFNAIVFSRNDITPWGQKFLENIKNSQNWAKVFEDGYAIIYLKNDEENQTIIEKY